MRLNLAFGALAATLACGGASDGPSAPVVPKSLQVVNYLNESASLTVDGVTFGSVAASQTGTILIPGNAQILSYKLIKPRFSDGTFVPDEIDGESLALPAGAATVGITNVIAGVPYLSFSVLNSSGQSVLIGIINNGLIRCLASLPNFATQQFGYYRFNATTEVRSYRSGTNCSGTSAVWNNTVLSGYAINSGTIALNANIAP